MACGNNKNEMTRTLLKAKARLLVYSISLADFELYNNFQREELFSEISCF